MFWGKRLLLCSHYSASLYKGIHHSLSPCNSPKELRHPNTIARKICCPQATSASSPAAKPLQKIGHKTQLKSQQIILPHLLCIRQALGLCLCFTFHQEPSSSSPQAIQVLLSLHPREALLDLFTECLRHSLSMALAILFPVSGLCDFFLPSGYLFPSGSTVSPNYLINQSHASK